MNLCVDNQCFDVFVNIAELAYKTRMFCLISFNFRLFVIFVFLYCCLSGRVNRVF